VLLSATAAQQTDSMSNDTTTMTMSRAPAQQADANMTSAAAGTMMTTMHGTATTSTTKMEPTTEVQTHGRTTGVQGRL